MKTFFCAVLALLLSGVSVCADNALAVVNRADNTVSVVNLTTGQIATVPTEPGSHEALICNNRIIVSNYGAATPGHSLSVYGEGAATPYTTIDLAPLLKPHGMACSGSNIYVTTEGSQAVARVNLQSGKVEWVLGTGQKVGHMIALRGDALPLYVTNALSATVSEIKQLPPPALWDVSNIAVGKNPEGMDLSPDGSQVWAANRGDNSISVLDTAQKKVVANIPVESFIYRLRFTSDAKYVIATQPEQGNVLVFDPATRALVKTIHLGAPISVTVGTDPRFAYVVDVKNNEAVQIDLGTFAVTAHYPVGQGADGVAAGNVDLSNVVNKAK